MNLAITTSPYREEIQRCVVARGPFGRTCDEIEAAAQDEGLSSLCLDHWRVIQFVRAYFRDVGQAPALVRVARATGLKLRRLECLFPNGVVRTVFIIAGLEMPPDLQSCCLYARGCRPAMAQAPDAGESVN